MSERGQASLELLAALPFVLLAGILCLVAAAAFGLVKRPAVPAPA